MTPTDGPIALDYWNADERRFETLYLPHDRFVEILSVKETIVRAALGRGLARWWSGATTHPVLRVRALIREVSGNKPTTEESTWTFADSPVSRAAFGLPAKA